MICDGCPSHDPVEVMIPSEDWEVISRGAYRLCSVCIVERLRAAGLDVPRIRYEVGMHLKHSIWWRPSQIQVERDGSVGLPALRRGAAIWSSI